MAINPPVDATQTPEWAALQKHYDELQVEGVSLKKGSPRTPSASRSCPSTPATCTSICPRT